VARAGLRAGLGSEPRGARLLRVCACRCSSSWTRTRPVQTAARVWWSTALRRLHAKAPGCKAASRGPQRCGGGRAAWRPRGHAASGLDSTALTAVTSTAFARRPWSPSRTPPWTEGLGRSRWTGRPLLDGLRRLLAFMRVASSHSCASPPRIHARRLLAFMRVGLSHAGRPRSPATSTRRRRRRRPIATYRALPHRLCPPVDSHPRPASGVPAPAAAGRRCQLCRRPC
jgi:hypothetical protein